MLHTVIKTHYRYFSGVLLTLLSEYLQAEHTLWLPGLYNFAHMPSQVVSESTQQQQDIMWKSATRDTQEEKEKKSFLRTKGADKNHML